MSVRAARDVDALTRALHDALPQTQCTRCGYPDCAAYAQAIACDSAPINQCPPGGQHGVQRLAAITGRPVLPLNPAHGAESQRQLAAIDEAWCIGCTLCLQACPVDCIIGAAKLMHVVAPTQCTGCELCVPACPVDCISMVPAPVSGTGWDAWSAAQAQQARERYEWHRQRLTRDAQAKSRELDRQSLDDTAAVSVGVDTPTKASLIQAVLARARAARAP